MRFGVNYERFGGLFSKRNINIISNKNNNDKSKASYHFIFLMIDFHKIKCVCFI